MRSARVLLVASLSLSCAPHAEAPPADEPAEIHEDERPGPAEPAKVEPVPGTRELTVLQLPEVDGGPAHEVIVGVDGSLWFHGRGGEPRSGVHTGRVPPPLVHAAVRAALDAGYTDDPAEPVIRMGDKVFFTSVLVDRRHAMRSTDSGGGPRGAYLLVKAVDDMLARTSWDPSPRREAVDAATCPDLARAIASRCGEYLQFERGAGDCGYFLDVAADLYDEPDGEAHRQRCARHMQQLAAPPPTTTTMEPPRMGARCKAWVKQKVAPCLGSLKEGRFDRLWCRLVREQMPELVPILQAEAAKSLAAGAESSEAWCDDRVGGYAR